MGRRARDLTGQQFGLLTVLQRAANKGRWTCWECTIDQALLCAELWDVWNGITLCKECHDKIHNEEKTRGRPKN